MRRSSPRAIAMSRPRNSSTSRAASATRRCSHSPSAGNAARSTTPSGRRRTRPPTPNDRSSRATSTTPRETTRATRVPLYLDRQTLAGRLSRAARAGAGRMARAAPRRRARQELELPPVRSTPAPGRPGGRLVDDGFAGALDAGAVPVLPPLRRVPRWAPASRLRQADDARRGRPVERHHDPRPRCDPQPARDDQLEPEARKLLSFTDNRQDASLQAGHFNDFVEVGLIRSALYRAADDGRSKTGSRTTSSR